jgi:hypothetical protein
MKTYEISARPAKKVWTLNYKQVEAAVNAFPVQVDAKNKGAAKEIAEGIARDLGAEQREIVFTISAIN